MSGAWADIINLSLSAVVGAATSWGISAYYFRRVTRAEMIGDQVKAGLQNALYPIVFPELFDPDNSILIYPNEPTPTNTDIPHVEFLRLDKRTIVPGQNMLGLMKVRDTGFNLRNPQGIRVYDHSGRFVSVTGLGLGYCRFKVHVSEYTAPGLHKIVVELSDNGSGPKVPPKFNQQTLSFLVQGG